MPVIYAMLFVVALLGTLSQVDLEFASGMTKKEYAQECDRRGGVVLFGLTPRGKDGVGCYNIKELEIK